MDRKKKYEVYCMMQKKAKETEERLKRVLYLKYPKVYTVFVSPCDEENETYFIDIEVGGTPETYHRWRGECPYKTIERRFFEGVKI